MEREEPNRVWGRTLQTEETARTKAPRQEHARSGLREGQVGLADGLKWPPHPLASAHLAESKGLLSNGLKKKDPPIPVGEAKGLSGEEGGRERKGVETRGGPHCSDA